MSAYIRHLSTLVFYDFPQVFEARDSIGGHYISFLADDSQPEPLYVVAGVNPEQLRQFRTGLIDLRELILDRPIKDWFLSSIGDVSGWLEIKPQSTPLEDSDFLPDEGFVIHSQYTLETALQEAQARNNLILELAVEPPESAEEHRIHLSTLAELLSNFQNVVKYAYQSACRELSAKVKKVHEVKDAYLMDVVIPAAPGSFRIVLEAARSSNLFGQNDLSRGFEILDLLFSDSLNPDSALTAIKAHKGHFAGAYIRLLEFLVKHHTGIGYSWAEPNFHEARTSSISSARATSLVTLFSEVKDLGSETFEKIVTIEKIDEPKGTWGVVADGVKYSGRIKEGGPSLIGIEIGSKYSFKWVEEIQGIEASGKEKRALYLLSHSKTL